MKFLLVILFAIITSTVLLPSHANEDWKTIHVLTEADNKTEYVFLYSPHDIALNRIFSENSLQLDMMFNVTGNSNEYFELKVPKNFPMDDHTILVTYVTYYNNSREFFLDDASDTHNNIYTLKENECFYHISVFLSGIKSVGFTFGVIPGLDSSYLKSSPVSDSCLLQTIVGHRPILNSIDDLYEQWKNLRGETTLIFPHSVEKLVERGYLVEPLENIPKTQYNYSSTPQIKV